MRSYKIYLQKYKQGDLQARDVLIERNLRLVAHVVKKYQGAGEDLDDLISMNREFQIMITVPSGRKSSEKKSRGQESKEKTLTFDLEKEVTDMKIMEQEVFKYVTVGKTIFKLFAIGRLQMGMKKN